MVIVKDRATADEARRRSAEAVLRIREESRLRVVRQRHRSCFSWCMVASLVGGISLAGMDAYEARLERVQAEEAEQAARQAAQSNEPIMLEIGWPEECFHFLDVGLFPPDERDRIRAEYEADCLAHPRSPASKTHNDRYR
jgi:hypothetical protein